MFGRASPESEAPERRQFNERNAVVRRGSSAFFPTAEISSDGYLASPGLYGAISESTSGELYGLEGPVSDPCTRSVSLPYH